MKSSVSITKVCYAGILGGCQHLCRVRYFRFCWGAEMRESEFELVEKVFKSSSGKS